MARSKLMVIVGATMALLAYFLPWLSFFIFSITGSQVMTIMFRPPTSMPQVVLGVSFALLPLVAIFLLIRIRRSYRGDRYAPFGGVICLIPCVLFPVLGMKALAEMSPIHSQPSPPSAPALPGMADLHINLTSFLGEGFWMCLIAAIVLLLSGAVRSGEGAISVQPDSTPADVGQAVRRTAVPSVETPSPD